MNISDAMFELVERNVTVIVGKPQNKVADCWLALNSFVQQSTGASIVYSEVMIDCQQIKTIVLSVTVVDAVAVVRRI